MNYLPFLKKFEIQKKTGKHTRLYQTTKTRPTFSKVQEKLRVVKISAGFLEIASKVKKNIATTVIPTQHFLLTF